MRQESIYAPHRGMREIEEGQTAQQCEEAPCQPSLTLLEQEQEKRRAHEAMVAAKQEELAELKRQYEVSVAVLQDSQASENAQNAASISCDEIQEEQKQVQAQLDVLLTPAKQSDLEASLTIPQDIYTDKSPKKPPFHFGKGK